MTIIIIIYNLDKYFSLSMHTNSIGLKWLALKTHWWNKFWIIDKLIVISFLSHPKTPVSLSPPQTYFLMAFQEAKKIVIYPKRLSCMDQTLHLSVNCKVQTQTYPIHHHQLIIATTTIITTTVAHDCMWQAASAIHTTCIKIK